MSLDRYLSIVHATCLAAGASAVCGDPAGVNAFWKLLMCHTGGALAL
jgi:hypothetical protein